MIAEQRYEVETEFERGNATYKPDEIIAGSIMLKLKTSSTFKIDISSITITPKGLLSIQNRQNNKKVQKMSKEIQPLELFKLEKSLNLVKNKTITHDTKIPFKFKLSKNEHRLLQTYIGVYLTIGYEIMIDIQFTGSLRLVETVPFYVQVPKQGRQCIQNFIYPKKKNFMIRSQDLKGASQKFKVRGEFQSQICYFAQDLNGYIIVDYADAPIRSIDVQMYRIEKISSQTDKIVERTQIQLIQMCDGNVTKNLQLPIYMILPRYYACPSVKYLWCEIDFQIDLILIFKDGLKVTSNIPLKLIRS